MSILPDRTRNAARLLRGFCLAAMGGLIAIMVGLTLLTVGLSAVTSLLTDAAFDMAGVAEPWPLGVAARIGLVLVAWAGAAAILYTLFHMARLFECYARDRALTPEAATDIRRIGQGLLAQAAVGLLANTAVGLLLSLDAAPGQRMLTLTFDAQEFGFALAGGLMLMIGVVMRQAVEVARENAGFV